MSDDAPEGSRADWLADKVLRGLIGSLLRLPYETRVPLMGSALRHAIGPLAGYRRRAEENLSLIYPQMPAIDRRRLAADVCDNFGRTLIENYSHEAFGERLRGMPISGDGASAVAKAERDGRSVLFVTGHYGNHEAPRHVLASHGHEVGGLYRPMSNPYFNAHYAQTMTSWGGPVFEQGNRGTMGFARHLRGGGWGTLLFDVNRHDGVEVPFMGRTALTAPSAAEIALKFDCVVIPYFGIRQDDGLSFEVTFEHPIAHADPVVMMAEMNARLEARVRADPGQWFWVHRRWKGAIKRGL